MNNGNTTIVDVYDMQTGRRARLAVYEISEASASSGGWHGGGVNKRKTVA
jgi:hypothetical protein